MTTITPADKIEGVSAKELGADQRDEQAVALKYGRWDLASDGFGVVASKDGIYCYYADAESVISALRAEVAGHKDDSLRLHKDKCDWMDRALAAEAALAARPNSHVDTTPEEAAKIIIDDLIARKGFDACWDGCDAIIRQEITEEIAGVIRSAARPAEDGLAERLEKLAGNYPVLSEGVDIDVGHWMEDAIGEMTNAALALRGRQA